MRDIFFPKNYHTHTLNPAIYSISNSKFQFYKITSDVISLIIDKFKLKSYIKLKIKNKKSHHTCGYFVSSKIPLTLLCLSKDKTKGQLNKNACLTCIKILSIKQKHCLFKYLKPSNHLNSRFQKKIILNFI